MEEQNTLEAAIHAVQQKDYARARVILGDVLKAQPGNEQAYLLWADTTENKKHQIHCLEQALKINPSNQITRDRLARLRTTHRFKVIGLGAVIMLAMCASLMFSVYSGTPSSLRNSSSPSNHQTAHKVVYRITGNSTFTASVTYTNEQGGTEQMDIGLPWDTSFSANAGQFVYISAQNGSSNDRSSITCEIMIDGVSYKESTSRGAYKIASCSGSAG